MTRKTIEKIIIVILGGMLLFSIFYLFVNRDRGVGKIEVKSSGAVFKLAKMVLSGEKTFLVLLQNNMELRPGGGYIGSFGIIKIKNGKVTSYEIHDTSNFDGRIPDNHDMPEPMKKVFRIEAWKLRDSNYSPDYPTNAKKALDFYYQGQGQEKFDGVIAFNAASLESVLSITGPVRVEGYPIVFESGSALITLEKQVEIDFAKQGIEIADRKNVMNDFLDQVLKKAVTLSKLEKVKLAKVLVGEFENKNLQIYFNDNQEGSELIKDLGWDGKVDSGWKGDYIMAVDANIGAYKSDYFIKRSMHYNVDLTTPVPQATLKITYEHTGKTKDWMTRDYLSYLRVYLPQKSVVTKFNDNVEVEYGEEFNKKFAGGFVKTLLNSTKTFELKYDLPQEFKTKDYTLKIQKQSGVSNIPTVVDIKLANGETKHFDLNLDKDTVVVK